MLFAIIFALCVAMALGAGLASAYSDFRGMQIPNRYSLVVIAVFFLAYGILSAGQVENEVFAPILSHILAALLMFAITFLMFVARILGAGDSKLATSFAFWTGLSYLPVFLFVMAMAGVVLSVFSLVMKKKILWPQAPQGSWPARVQAGESAVPYGVAIACGAIAAFIKAGYPEFVMSVL